MPHLHLHECVFPLKVHKPPISQQNSKEKSLIPGHCLRTKNVPSAGLDKKYDV